MQEQLSPEQTKAIEQIQKLLNLAAKNPNQHEAAAATAKAQELLAKYNLDSATVEGNSDKEGRREELKTDGGFYSFQRDLWRSVADLNFCLYWTQMYRSTASRYVDKYTGAKSMKKTDTNERQKVDVLKYRHALVGRMVNTRTTVVMAEYLQQAIERVTTEYMRNNETNIMSNWAASFRKGLAAGVIEKIEDERSAHLAKERKKKRDAERAGHNASTGTSMVLSTYIDSETDANMDFVHGEGWSARQAARMAEAAREREERIAAHTKWAAENPEEARAQEEERKKLAGKSRYRGGSSPKDNTDYSAYYAGKDQAKQISIHRQADAPSKQARIAR